MKRGSIVLFVIFMLRFAGPAVAQSVPEIPFDSAPNFLKLPDGLYLGEAAGVATNSKGHVFVYTRTGSPRVTIGTNRTFARTSARFRASSSSSAGAFISSANEASPKRSRLRRRMS